MPLKVRVKYIVLIAVFNLLTYFGIQQLASSSVVDLLTPADRSIPLIPEFIWIYNSLIPVLLASCIFLLRTRKIFWTACLAFVLATVVLDVFYVVMPSFYPRESFEITNLSAWFLNVTREIDGSNNTFPSGHVALSWLLFWSAINSKCLQGKRIIKFAYGMWAATISISTLTLKQHYIADVLGGFVLAYGCWVGAAWLVERAQKQKNSQPSLEVSIEASAQLAE